MLEIMIVIIKDCVFYSTRKCALIKVVCLSSRLDKKNSFTNTIFISFSHYISANGVTQNLVRSSNTIPLAHDLTRDLSAAPLKKHS